MESKLLTLNIYIVLFMPKKSKLRRYKHPSVKLQSIAGNPSYVTYAADLKSELRAFFDKIISHQDCKTGNT